MEYQWPLILFTLFMAWSAGVFGTQAVLALKDCGRRLQMPALVISVVLLAVGGIAVFFHLEHWDRIFNGFGNPTSGITQELIAVVVLAVVMVLYFVYLRRPGGNVPAWLAVCALVVSVVLVVVMSHSYNMAARPAWDSPLLWLAYLGNAAVFGPLTLLVLGALVKGDTDVADPSGEATAVEAADAEGVTTKALGLCAVAGAAANALLSVVYGAAVMASASAFSQVGLYFDPTHPNQPMANPAEAANILSGDAAMLFWIGVVAIGCVAPLVCALLARRRTSATTGATGAAGIAAAGLACAVVGAVCLRMAFYAAGASVFMFY